MDIVAELREGLPNSTHFLLADKEHLRGGSITKLGDPETSNLITTLGLFITFCVKRAHMSRKVKKEHLVESQVAFVLHYT